MNENYCEEFLVLDKYTTYWSFTYELVGIIFDKFVQ